MKIRNLSLFILMFIIHLACHSGSKIDYKIVSKHLCSCSVELYRRNKNFEDLVKTKKQDKAIILMDSIEVDEEKFQSCLLDENKKQKLFEDHNMMKLLSNSLNSTCPEKKILIMKVVEDTKFKLSE
ncbi:MAG TPA: hypothetical protein VK590_08050 [Saprospiraceae bacterium]|nr:hypothetical protein [Saprospiraceae bacterium]